MSTKMRAVLVKGGAGTADDLYVGEYDKPVPKKGEVLVKIKAAGVNRMDVYQRIRGAVPLPHINKDILGVEFAGTVEGIGEGVSDHKIGDEVFSLVSGAAYAEYITVRSSLVMPKPPHLSFVEAASIPEVWFTAYQAVVLIGGITKGKSILVHGGASGVGVAANQIARFLGAKYVFTTAGSDEKVKFLLSIKEGPTHAINYKTQDFAEEIDRVTNGEGVDIVIDLVGKDYLTRNIKVLKMEGRLVLIAMQSGSVASEFDFAPVAMKRLRIEGSTLRTRSPEYQDDLARRFVKELLPDFTAEKGQEPLLKTYIYKTYPFEKAGDAHKDIEANKNSGKLVLVVE
ncbi:quinone oxidoreductase putative [Calocera viscosa TUFC12733]|uniref:Quinone oxidoreductase putative n=1 Tax=Calocera viscosa (strain TUFC12733) TaxID=1330018 RepID=A0A167MIP3_CALVF|nr:quinone oxidoreductase putative [Calocera viscosa TUFC12733]